MKLIEYDDLDPSCARALADLRIYSDTLPAAEMEKLIGVPPTEVMIKDRLVTLPSGVQRVQKFHAYFLNSEAFVASRDLRRHLDALLARIADRGEGLHALWRTGEVECAISCLWWAAHGHGGPRLRADQLALMAELGLEWTCDFTYLD